ncbi:hypothetical protein LCGC14_2235880 [marine sediment metagenome]|uniref:Uncharacterized protein n=1 Tax=marine sediment metagenome TaxID=412755 RepID=A0A0F9D743_9ZZZZ
MSTVYTHIKPFQKRAIDFLQQEVGSLGEPDEIHGTISELTRRQDFFNELRASLGLSTMSEQGAYIESRVAGITQALTEANAEKAMLKSLLKLLNPCRACYGRGDIRTHTSQDESYLTRCGGCDGTGVYKGAE